jgi:predicted acetyltransferase
LIITLRVATTADLPAVAAMNKLLIEDEKHENPMSVAELEERVRGWISSNYAAYMFQLEEKTIGYALVNMEAKPIYLRQFFIARDWRRQGAGTAGFKALLRELRTETLEIDVLVWNKSAIAFWTALGFDQRSLRMRYCADR